MYLVGNGQLLATLGAAGSQHAAAIGSLHALTEAMLVISLSVVRLECSFHFLMLLLIVSVSTLLGCKFTTIYPISQGARAFFTLRSASTARK